MINLLLSAQGFLSNTLVLLNNNFLFKKGKDIDHCKIDNLLVILE